MIFNHNGKQEAMPPEYERGYLDELNKILPTQSESTDQKLAQMQAQIDALLEGRTGA